MKKMKFKIPKNLNGQVKTGAEVSVNTNGGVTTQTGNEQVGASADASYNASAEASASAEAGIDGTMAHASAEAHVSAEVNAEVNARSTRQPRFRWWC